MEILTPQFPELTELKKNVCVDVLVINYFPTYNPFSLCFLVKCSEKATFVSVTSSDLRI